MPRPARLLINAIVALFALALGSVTASAQPEPTLRAHGEQVLERFAAEHYGSFPKDTPQNRQFFDRVHKKREVNSRLKNGAERTKHYIDGKHVRTDLYYPSTGTRVSYRKGTTLSATRVFPDGKTPSNLKRAAARGESELYRPNPTVRIVQRPSEDGRSLTTRVSVQERQSGVHDRAGREVGQGMQHLYGWRKTLVDYRNGTQVEYTPLKWGIAKVEGNPRGVHTIGREISVTRSRAPLPKRTFVPTRMHQKRCEISVARSRAPVQKRTFVPTRMQQKR